MHAVDRSSTLGWGQSVLDHPNEHNYENIHDYVNDEVCIALRDLIIHCMVQVMGY